MAITRNKNWKEAATQDMQSKNNYFLYKFVSAKRVRTMEFLIKLIRQYNKKNIELSPTLHLNFTFYTEALFEKQHCIIQN